MRKMLINVLFAAGLTAIIAMVNKFTGFETIITFLLFNIAFELQDIKKD